MANIDNLAEQAVMSGGPCNCPRNINPMSWQAAVRRARMALTAATGWGECEVPDVPLERDANGCAVQERRCRTPIRVTASLSNANPDTVLPIPTVGSGFLTHLLCIQGGTIGQVLLVNLQQGSRSYFPNGPLPFELYTRGWDSVGNLLPSRVKLRPDVQPTLTVRATVAGPVVFEAVFLATVAED